MKNNKKKSRFTAIRFSPELDQTINETVEFIRKNYTTAENVPKIDVIQMVMELGCKIVLSGQMRFEVKKEQ
jgi:hypothetical protein